MGIPFRQEATQRSQTLCGCRRLKGVGLLAEESRNATPEESSQAAELCPPLCQTQLSLSSLQPLSHLGSPRATQSLAPRPGRSTTLPEAARDAGGAFLGSGLTFIFQLVLSVGSIDFVDVELRSACTE